MYLSGAELAIHVGRQAFFFLLELFTHNSIQFPLVVLTRRLEQDLVQQCARVRVCISGTLDVAGVVELDCRVGFLQCAREHGFLRRRPAAPVSCAPGRVGAAIWPLRPGAGLGPGLGPGGLDGAGLAAVIHSGGWATVSAVVGVHNLHRRGRKSTRLGRRRSNGGHRGLRGLCITKVERLDVVLGAELPKMRTPLRCRAFREGCCSALDFLLQGRERNDGREAREGGDAKRGRRARAAAPRGVAEGRALAGLSGPVLLQLSRGRLGGRWRCRRRRRRGCRGVLPGLDLGAEGVDAQAAAEAGGALVAVV